MARQPTDSSYVTSSARTVTHLSSYLKELQQSATEFADVVRAVDRGYFSPDEEIRARQILVSYWQVRGALFEVVMTCRRRLDSADTDGIDQEEEDALFLIGFAAALVLVDAARFLRRIGSHPVVRRKLNEAAPDFGIPGGTFDTVQRSLVSTRHAWHLYHALRHFEAQQARWRDKVEGPLQEVFAVIEDLRGRVDISLGEFASARWRTRADQAIRQVGRSTVKQALYGLQKLFSSMMSDVFVRPGHEPSVPANVRQEIRGVLRMGDVLLTRKEYALTNYFLPGYWPHAALYIGTPEELARHGLQHHQHVATRWSRLLELAAESSEGNRHCVLEALKDGVHFRTLDSPLSADSTVILRPDLTMDQIVSGLARTIRHESKPYDFDFDFTRSDRLVCTEVVYRAFDGIGPVRFSLVRRAGRPTLSGLDLTRLSLSQSWLKPVAMYDRNLAPQLVHDDEVPPLMRLAIGEA